MTRPVPIIVLVLLMASAMAGSVPDGGGADDGTSSTEDRSPQIFIVDDSGGVAFSTIQSAIDAASHGDFIRVYAGYYRENITIDKGVHLIGNETYTWISNDGTRDVVTVLASPFTIKGFNIASQFKYSSIKLYYVDTGLIENCHISGSGIINGNGIRGDDGCNNITIVNNIFDQDGNQAILLGGDGNLIEANSFYLNHIGVSIHGNDNRIVNNTFEESEYGVRLGHFSQDVLLMGNSYTNANNLARLVEGQLDIITTDAVATPLTGGGLTLSDHATRAQTSGHQWNVTLNNGRSWEAVILQDQSQIPGFPITGLYWQQSMAAARVLDAMIEDRYADTIFLMTWGRRDGDPTNPGLYPNFTVMQARLEAGYGYYAENLSAEDRPVYIAPAGLAFKRVHDDIVAGGVDPTTPGTLFYDLYSSDGSHPSLSGSYLASCVLYATLTGNTPVGLQDGVNINAPRKLALQEAAAAAVFDDTPGYKYPWRRTAGNLVDGNTFEVKGTGLTIGCGAEGNTVSNNSFSGGSGPGVLVRDGASKGNTIHHNGFRDTNLGAAQARDDRNGNAWDDGSEGNYWSDYISRYPGATNDGVVWHVPYGIIGGGADRYPLVQFPAFEDHDPPVAFAGADRIEDEDTGVELDGRGSYDEVGVVNYTWTFGYEGETIVLYGPKVEFQFDVPGVYNVTLNVTDAAGNWDVDQVVLTILDTTRPTAWITPLGPIDQHETVTFNGSRSYDNVGIVNWTWRFSDVYGDVSLYGEVVEFMFDIADRYMVLLMVTDATGNNGTEAMYFTVRDIDPPVADAGSDLTIDQGRFVTFDGMRSWDNVGIASYIWTIQNGTANITLLGPSVDHQFNELGLFLVTLTVTDLAGNFANDTLNVTVGDIEPPVADAGGDRTVNQGQTFTLNGYGSTDNDGIYWYIWTNDIHPNSTYDEAIHKIMISIAGVFNFTLTVRDAAGNEDSDSITITVRDTTHPQALPVEVRSADQGDEVTLDGSASTDNVGIVDWRWTIVYDGRTSYLDGENVSFTFDVPGDAVITLMVTDAVDLTGEVTFDLHVRDTIPPISPLLEDRVVEVGDKVTMFASGAQDNVGIISWTWTVNGGRETVLLEGEEVDHVFEEPGEYKVTLTLEDADGNLAQESFTVTVEGDSWAFVALVVGLAVLVTMLVYYMRPAKGDDT